MFHFKQFAGRDGNKISARLAVDWVAFIMTNSFTLALMPPKETQSINRRRTQHRPQESKHLRVGSNSRLALTGRPLSQGSKARTSQHVPRLVWAHSSTLLTPLGDNPECHPFINFFLLFQEDTHFIIFFLFPLPSSPPLW